MNQNIQHLYEIASKPKKTILGLMSGTSLDGLDMAICEIAGNGFDTNLKVIAFETAAYSYSFRNYLKKCCFNPHVHLEEICRLNAKIGRYHADLINDFLNRHQIPRDSIDAIASHGQTVFHAPVETVDTKQNPFHSTLQLGDGDHIAMGTGILTISDFRQKHIAAGGEGAPLAPYGDLLLFGEQDKNVLLINIGGISNFTFIPSCFSETSIRFGDIGPGNALMDAWIQKIDSNAYFDTDGKMAASGVVNEKLLAILRNLQHTKPNTKSKGKELFHLDFILEALSLLQDVPPAHEDIMATLNEWTASLISETILKFHTSDQPMKLYCSGGGVSNIRLMQHLHSAITGKNIELADCREKGIEPDAKEAVIFALLANESLSGDPAVWSAISPYVSFGKISFPH